MKEKSLPSHCSMQKIKDFFCPYWTVALLYVVVILVIKVSELFFVPKTDISWIELASRDLTYNLIVVSWTLIGLSLLYGLISLASHKVAIVIVSVLFALLTLSELGLTIYASHNGFLLGSELFARPLGETMLAIVGAAGVVIPIAGSLLILVGMTWIAIFLSHKNWRFPIVTLPLALLFAILSLLFPVHHLQDNKHDTYILNKTHYLCLDGWRYLCSEKDHTRGITREIAYDPQMLDYIRETHPEWIPIEAHYPLERVDYTPDFLSPFFASSDRLPNVVLIVVESLGDEIMGSGLMPFVDSLASQGLYWRNCLSSSMRSYGAIPALTGSVGGPKSFQFGNMPDHNSLLSLLRKEGYHTQAFYAGDFTFDCIFDYLQAQHIDYLSPFYERCNAVKNNPEGNWWGYHDGPMLRLTMEEINRHPDHQPYLSLITTLTMHESLALADKQEQQRYEQQAAQVTKQSSFAFLKDRGAACAYTDDCLRRFFSEYSKRPDFQNTIFVLTGDHASGLVQDNKLCFHHVPLIMFSPLLKHSQTFDHRVTHNDVAPSLYRLLTLHYGLPPAPSVHWLGNGLDPAPKTMLIVSYNQEMQEMLWGDYYYQTGNDWEPEGVFLIDADLGMTPVIDESVLLRCRQQMQALRYLYEYTYYNNRLTRNPVYPRLQYQPVVNYAPATTLYCETPHYKPSEKGNRRYYLLPQTQLKGTQGFTMARITFSADVLILDSLWQDDYMELAFSFYNGKEYLASDKISKFINVERLRKDSLYHVEISKEFPINDTSPNRASVFMQTAQYDDVWKPGTRLVVKNRQISISYGK